MARDYNGTSGYSSLTYSSFGTLPIHIFAMANCDDQTLQQYLMGMSMTAGDVNYAVDFLGASTDKCRMRQSNGTTNTTASSTASYVAGTWHSVLYEQAGGGYNVYFDGIAHSSSSITFPNGNQPTTWTLGALAAFSTVFGFFNGRLAKWAVWQGIPAPFTGAEAMQLHKGFSPRRVFPQYLKMYRHLVRETGDLRDIMGALSEAGSPGVGVHPSSYGF